MRTATLVTQMLLRICFLALIVLGVLFWTGHATGLVALHMSVGGIFVLLMWVMALLGFRARAGADLVLMTLVGGFIVLGLGMTQTRLMVGDAHWIVRVVHLLVGLAAIALTERIGARIRA